MTTNHRHPCSRRALSAAVALAPFAASACAGDPSSWAIRRELSTFTLPRHLPTFVFTSAEVRHIDRDGYIDLVAGSLEDELNRAGVTSEIIKVAATPRLPRVELAFYRLELPPPELAHYNSLYVTHMTVDCAFVSAADEVAFIGRVIGSGEDGNVSLAADAAGRAIGRALTHG
jgi:hypothetical protein